MSEHSGSWAASCLARFFEEVASQRVTFHAVDLCVLRRNVKTSRAVIFGGTQVPFGIHVPRSNFPMTSCHLDKIVAKKSRKVVQGWQ